MSIETLTSIFQVSVRYQTSPSTSAHTQAAIAPSVGVNTPVVIPPIRNTGVMIGITASNFHFQSAANSTTSPTPTATLNGSPALMPTQIASGQPNTIASSRNALPIRCHSNATSPPQPFLCAK